MRPHPLELLSQTREACSLPAETLAPCPLKSLAPCAREQAIAPFADHIALSASLGGAALSRRITVHRVAVTAGEEASVWLQARDFCHWHG